MHCHVAWHSSQGFALQLVEFQDQMAGQLTDNYDLGRLCMTWNAYTKNEMYVQHDSGI